MSVSTTQDYRELLSSVAPRPIHSEAENERALALLEELAGKPMVSQAEQQLIELLCVLIEDFEGRRYQPKRRAKPAEVLRELMAANGLKQKDLVNVFGSPSIVSEVLHERRGLTVEHIRKLARRFNVSPAVFIA
jgi:HTH-type transcriptional regulator/antitoxin HigA